jgi:hypothetical protein
VTVSLRVRNWLSRIVHPERYLPSGGAMNTGDSQLTNGPVIRLPAMRTFPTLGALPQPPFANNAKR